jgi:hypothetical protein
MNGREWVHDHNNRAAIMQKTQAVAVMGQRSLLIPGWIKTALAGYDHLKLYLAYCRLLSRMPITPITRYSN